MLTNDDSGFDYGILWYPWHEKKKSLHSRYEKWDMVQTIAKKK